MDGELRAKIKVDLMNVKFDDLNELLRENILTAAQREIAEVLSQEFRADMKRATRESVLTTIEGQLQQFVTTQLAEQAKQNIVRDVDLSKVRIHVPPR